MVSNLWKMVGPIPNRVGWGLELVLSFGTENFAGYLMCQQGLGARVLAAPPRSCLRRIYSAVESFPPLPGSGIVRVVTHLGTSETEELELLLAIANCLHPISSSAVQRIEVANEFDAHSL